MASEAQLRANRLNARTAGRPKGRKNNRTLSKELAREALRQQVTAALLPLVSAQIAHAQGSGHLYRRDVAGKYARIEDQTQIDEILARGLEGDDAGTYWIFAKDPSVQAFTALLDRALDKPKEQAQEVDITIHEGRRARLKAGQQRASRP